MDKGYVIRKGGRFSAVGNGDIGRGLSIWTEDLNAAFIFADLEEARSWIDPTAGEEVAEVLITYSIGAVVPPGEG